MPNILAVRNTNIILNNTSLKTTKKLNIAIE